MVNNSNDMDLNSYDIGASAAAQANFDTVARKLESALNDHSANVKVMMAQYQADGVSDQHQANEQKWDTAANQVHGIINAIRKSLGESDGHAQTALNQANQAVS